jgi:hypothetical protein
MAKFHRALWLRFLLLTLLSGMASAQMVPSDDTYVTGASPTLASGSSTSLVVQGSSVGKPSYSFIRFDLKPLTGVSSTQVQSAYLRVYVSAVTASGGFNVYEVTPPTSWVEGTLTYSGGGSTATGTLLNTGGPILVPYPNGKYVYFDVDVTQALKDWLANPTANNGLVLKPADNNISVSFSSKEDSTYSQVPTLTTVLSPNAAQIVGPIGPNQVAPGNYNINAATATLAGGLSNQSPTQCPSGLTTGVTNTGNAVCLLVPLSIPNGGTGAIDSATALSNLGGVSATTLNIETAARVAADALEASARATADTTLQNNINGEAARATAAEATKASLSGNNSFTGTNTFTGATVDLSHATATLPVQTVTGTPPANNNVCLAGQMVLQKDGAPGQQLFICNAAFNGWVLVNDDTATTNAAKAYTDAQIVIEATARTTGDAATLASANGHADAGDAATLASANAHADSGDVATLAAANASVGIEAAARMAGDANTLAAANTHADAGDAATKSDILTLPQTFSGNETFSGNNSFGGINTFTNKVDLSAAKTLPVQTTMAIPPANNSPNACIDGQMLLQINGTPGQQLFICNAANDGWVMVNDDAATAAAANTYTNNAVAAEAALRTAADGAEATARAGADAAEILARQQGDAFTLASANTYTDQTKTNILTLPQTFSGNETFSGNNSFGGINTFTNKVDLSAAKTLPVQTTMAIPPANNSPNACIDGQMLLQINGTPGQQLFICNAAGDGWVMVNDDSATSSAANAYTDAQVLIEKNRAMGAEGTLTTNLNSEINRATASEAAEASTRQTADAAEAAARIAADAALSAGISAETTRATAAEGTLSSGLSSETSRATAAEATKADLVKPVQLDTAAAVNGSCTAVNALVLNPSKPSGQQLFVCRDIGTNVRQWELINDDSATTSSANQYTDTAVAAEAALRQAADTAEATARQQGDANTLTAANAHSDAGDVATLASANAHSDAAVLAESVLRATGDATTLSSAKAYTDGQITTVNASLAGKANLTGGNTFTGDQSITGNISVTGTETVNGTLALPATGTATAGNPFNSNALDLISSSFSGGGALNEKFRWQAEGNGSSNAGSLNLLFGSGANTPAETGLSIDNTGKITFATGQTFPGTTNGTVTSITAGTGLSGGTINTSGTIALNPATSGTLGGVIAPTCAVGSHFSGIGVGGTLTCSIDATTTSLPFSAITAGANTAALTVDSTGTLTPTNGGSITANFVPVSGGAAPTANGAIAYDSTAKQFKVGVNGASNTLALLSGSNVFLGGKQTLAPSATGFASLNFPNSGVTPTTPTPAIGDLWLTTGDPHLQFQSAAGTTKSLAFTTDVGGGTVGGDISGTVSNATVAKVNGVSYGPTPSTNTVPVVTASNAVTYEQVPNAALANSSTSVNGQICTLGGSCTVTATSSGTASGDLSGTYPSPTIAKLQGTTIAVSGGNAPTSGQVLSYNGTQWQPASITGSGFGAQSANTVFAGPTTGAATNPTFRALAAADLPAATATAQGAVKPTQVSTATTLSVVGSGTASASATCNTLAGRVLLGGGYVITPPNFNPKLVVIASGPDATNTQWTVTVGNTAGSTMTQPITVTAICSGS